MRTIALRFVLITASLTATLVFAPVAFAQQWEFGGFAGGQFLSNVSASGAAGSATAGFAPGAAFGGFVGNNLYRNLSGEIRYEYLQNDLRLSSGGQTATFSGGAHAIHYDFIYHTNRKESNAQFFAALGGGVKLFRGAGAEQAYQPLSQFGYFTHTQQAKPMLSIGGGMTYRLAPHIYLRAEIRDFITPFPTKVLTPAPGVKYGSILNDLVPMIGIAYMY
jgi:hypothetical protein